METNYKIYFFFTVLADQREKLQIPKIIFFVEPLRSKKHQPSVNTVLQNLYK